jgi:hypothetical protein
MVTISWLTKGQTKESRCRDGDGARGVFPCGLRGLRLIDESMKMLANFQELMQKGGFKKAGTWSSPGNASRNESTAFK